MRIGPVEGLGLFLLLVVGGWLWHSLRQQRRQRRVLDRARREAELHRMLHEARRLLLRVGDEQSLFERTCQACVRDGFAALACVYRREGELAHRVAVAGPAAEWLRNVPSPLDLQHPEMRDTNTARVLRHGQSLSSNDYVLDVRAGRWRAEAVRQGVRSIAWIPLRRDANVAAVLLLFATEPDVFSPELMAHLEDLGEDISYALTRCSAPGAASEAPGGGAPQALGD